MAKGEFFGKSIIGRTTDDGWEVVEYLAKAGEFSGGAYSQSFKVVKEGKEGFMKAYDFQTYRDKNPDVDGAALQHKMLNHYLYERDLHQICSSGFFDKVCYAKGAGSLDIEVVPGVSIPVYYLIFDRADSDINVKLYPQPNVDESPLWKFRMLHRLAVAMKQLCTGEIYHQDIKPSNILCFPADEYKAGDLGRSFTQLRECPFASEPFWGDKRYMAPEISYCVAFPNLAYRAQMTDLYLFGSLIYQTFSGMPYSSVIYSILEPALHPGGSVSFDQALPALEEVHAKIVKDFEEGCKLPDDIKKRLCKCIEGLCRPNYEKRRHPQATSHIYNHMSNLEKIISTFNDLERRMELYVNKG